MIEKKSFGLDPWTEDEILNHLLNFMSAGHETTAISVALALHTLGSYPHMQKRLRDEIKAHITYYTSPEISGKGSAMSQVDIGTANNEIGSMKFLDNFVKESLRVHSHAKDLWIESVQILKGTTVIIMPQLAAYNKTIWGPTADEFDPDLWDNLTREAQSPHASQAFILLGRGYVLTSLSLRWSSKRF